MQGIASDAQQHQTLDQGDVSEGSRRQAQLPQGPATEPQKEMAMMQQQMTYAMQEAEQQLGALMRQLNQAESALQAASARIASLQVTSWQIWNGSSRAASAQQCNEGN